MDEKTAINAAGLIPEVYYDLIARVPAGGFVVLALLGLYHPELYRTVIEGKIETGVAVLLVFVFSVLSYAVGLLLSPLGNWIVERFWCRIFAEASCKYKDLIPGIMKDLAIAYYPLPTKGSSENSSSELAPEQISTSDQYGRIYRQLHEFLKEADPQAKVVLPKMQAEAALCANLTAGLLLVFVASVCRPRDMHLALVWTIIGLVLSIWGAWFRNKRLIHRHFSYFALFKQGGRKATAAARS